MDIVKFCMHGLTNRCSCLQLQTMKNMRIQLLYTNVFSSYSFKYAALSFQINGSLIFISYMFKFKKISFQVFAKYIFNGKDKEL